MKSVIPLYDDCISYPKEGELYQRRQKVWSINIDRSKKGTSHLYRTKPSITMGRMVYSTLIWFWAMYSLDPRVLKMKNVDRLRDRKGVGDGLVLTTRTSRYCPQLPALYRYWMRF